MAFFKDLWIVPDDELDGNSKKKVKAKPIEHVETSSSPKFPTNTSTETVIQPVQKVVVGATNCTPFMDQVMEVYEKGFASLNKPGIEFFEFYQMVFDAGLDNPSAYGMAFKMLTSMEKTMTKETLIKESQFYINEIDKVHQNFLTNGNDRKSQLEEQRRVESHGLSSDIGLLEKQIQSLKNEIETKKMTLQQMDQKYNPQIEEVGCKLEANDHARNKIKSALQKCVNGITTNL